MSAIRGIVAKSLCELVKTGSKDLALKISKDKDYITIFESEKEDPIKINGSWTKVQPSYYVVVDFETQMMYDEKEYLQHGYDLRDLFLSIPEWYEC